MANRREERGSNALPPLYIEGYLRQRIEAGETPKYGYPTNHLPEPTVDEAEVVTCFMAARKSK